jgi:MFS family permease
MDRSLWAVLLGTFTLRFSTGLTGAMLSLYLSRLPDFDPAMARPSPLVIGIFAATFYLAELILSPLFGILSDRRGHHHVMLYGPAFGAVAVVITAFTSNLFLLGGTRWLEGASTAASIPSILGYIALVTAGSEALRGKAAARFEGATLAGIGVGIIAAPTLFGILGPGAFLLNAVIYGVSFLIYRFGVSDPEAERESIKLEHVGVRRYRELLGNAHVLLLAPTWIAVNASIGLWFSQSLFQLASPDPRFPEQFLLRGFSNAEITVGALAIAVVFGAGLLWWGNRFDRYRRTTIILWGVFGGIALAVAGFIVNHTAGSLTGPVGIGFVSAAVVIAAGGLFVLAGATPAAVGLLADVSERFPADRGAIMGLYSVFLAIGQIFGSLLGGLAAEWRGMDGLLIATGILLLVALVPLNGLRSSEQYATGLEGPAALADR